MAKLIIPSEQVKDLMKLYLLVGKNDDRLIMESARFFTDYAAFTVADKCFEEPVLVKLNDWQVADLIDELYPVDSDVPYAEFYWLKLITEAGTDERKRLEAFAHILNILLERVKFFLDLERRESRRQFAKSVELQLA